MTAKETKKDKSNYFKCKECGLFYKKKIWSKKCEEWCSKYKTCNLEITKHAIKN